MYLLNRAAISICLLSIGESIVALCRSNDTFGYSISHKLSITCVVHETHLVSIYKLESF